MPVCNAVIGTFSQRHRVLLNQTGPGTRRGGDRKVLPASEQEKGEGIAFISGLLPFGCTDSLTGEHPKLLAALLFLRVLRVCAAEHILPHVVVHLIGQTVLLPPTEVLCRRFKGREQVEGVLVVHETGGKQHAPSPTACRRGEVALRTAQRSNPLSIELIPDRALPGNVKCPSLQRTIQHRVDVRFQDLSPDGASDFVFLSWGQPFPQVILSSADFFLDLEINRLFRLRTFLQCVVEAS